VLAILIAGGVGMAAIAGALGPRLTESGGSGRVVLWQGALTAIRSHPLTGLGYGGFQPASIDLIFRTPDASLLNFDIPPGGQVAHSAYFGTAAELGIPGLILFVGLLWSTIRWLRRVAVHARAVQAWVVSRAAHALMVGVIGWAVASIFLSSETSRPLWVIIGVAVALPKLIHRSPAQRW
jgi:putative inorganic carbon (HCO3(-)) transporter